MNENMSEYEIQALKEIHAWKNPELTWFDKAMKIIDKPFDMAGDYIFETKVGDVIQKSISGIISVSNDIAQWSVRPDVIYKEYRDNGHYAISNANDIFQLDLRHVDRVIGWLDTKYKGVALVEGATTGAAGLPGIPPDVVALITLNLRAIGEYATYCGFDISSQHERLFAMNVLGLASSPSNAAKNIAMAQLIKIARDAGKKKAWKDLESYAFVKIIQNIAKALGVRLTKAKLGQIIPIAGAIVGGGFNSYYTSKVCEAAFYLYRERFLDEKYGDEDYIIESSVPPAPTLDADYLISGEV